MMEQKSFLKSLLYIIFFTIGSFFKINLIIGSKLAFFSGLNILGPLSSLYMGLAGGYIVLFFKAVLGLIISHTMFPITYYIPTFIASHYWIRKSWMIGFFIPFVCMMLFWMHPVGCQVKIYTLYWFIPMLLHMLSRKNIVTIALISTFVAHAIGSVMWLYIKPMTPDEFYMLLPIVAVERFIFAIGMVLVYMIIEKLSNVLAILLQKRFILLAH